MFALQIQEIDDTIKMSEHSLNSHFKLSAIATFKEFKNEEECRNA